MNQQIKGDEPQKGVQLLFVGFRESSHVLLERFCILSQRDGTTPGSIRHFRHYASLHVNSRSAFWFLFFLALFSGVLSLLFVSFLVSTTCQVGHFDSHTFWFLIEFFIENLVLTGGRYILPGP